VGYPSASEFDFTPRTRIVFGPGSVGRLGELARQHGATRVLVATDPGIVRAGHLARAEESLRAAGVWHVVFDRVVENPTTRTVEDCLSLARQESIDFLVGLGGGSSIDTAKGCNFLLSNGGRMEDYWGVGKALRPMLPSIAVPTTTGTGSECQSFALIAQPETHVKMACGDVKAAAKVALLDPELTLSQPPAVAASTGMDALSHAVESAVTRRRSPMSQMFSREAFRLCARGLRRVFEDPKDVSARGDVLLGAALGGLAIENSMLGAAHAAANPLSARFGVVHGQAIGLMLPAVVRFNAHEPEVREIYQQLALQAGLVGAGRNGSSGAAALADFLTSFRRRAGLPGSLAAVSVQAADLEPLADDAARQWTAGFNPRPVTAVDFADLYRSVLEGGDSGETPPTCKEGAVW
jgi:alcohol dehydrogenase